MLANDFNYYKMGSNLSQIGVKWLKCNFLIEVKTNTHMKNTCKSFDVYLQLMIAR